MKERTSNKRITYAPLWCKSNYTFLKGASHPEELVERAAELGLSYLALTDENGLYGVARAYVRAKELGVELIIGAQLTVSDSLEFIPGSIPRSSSNLILLAQDLRGYQNLCQLITLGKRRAAKGGFSLSWRHVCEGAKGLIALWDVIEYCNESAHNEPDYNTTVQQEPAGENAANEKIADKLKNHPEKIADRLKEAFGDRLYLVLSRNRHEDEHRKEIRIQSLARRYFIPVVAACEVLYHSPQRQPLQDVLTCIRKGVGIKNASAFTKPNHEYYLRGPRSFKRLYKGWSDAVRRSSEVAERCAFRLSELSYRYPAENIQGGRSEGEWLRTLTFQGAEQRYQGANQRCKQRCQGTNQRDKKRHQGAKQSHKNTLTASPGGDVSDGGGPPPEVIQQIEKELQLINELDYGGYFLTMHELVEFCRRRGILCQGRGSAANSVVCYCLGITAIDPVRMGLLFERFISRERAEPPDIDLDIQHERREEVIQHVYKRFGRSHAAMVSTVIRYRTRSAIREIGKVLGLPLTTLDHLAKLTGHWDDLTYAELCEVGLDPFARQNRLLMKLVNEIKGFPRHLSTHPGGFLIGGEPVSHLVPIENATMDGRTVIQWDKYDVEALGLFKIDLLGLGALTLVDRCLKLIRKYRGRELTLATIPHEDSRTFEMIDRADTVGVFQIESRAQMAMLPRLKPRRFYDLVIEISLVRPGPIAGDMVHPYLRRRQGAEPVEYPHPNLKPILEKTLGVPLFQEQVMKLAMVAADYTPGEADQLRRDMAAWRREGRLEKHRQNMIGRMLKKNISKEFAERVFHQIKGFGEYGFPESHAASFALICYATAWLKCHYPTEFACALLNSQPMGFYSPATIVEDARRHGVTVLPIDVNKSSSDCVLEPVRQRGYGIRMGMRYVKGLGKDQMDKIERARKQKTFTSLEDFHQRANERGNNVRKMSSRSLESLARAGGLESLDLCRRTTMWHLGGLLKNHGDELRLKPVEKTPKFEPLSPMEKTAWDHGTTGHSTRGHPLSLLRTELKRCGFPSAREIAAMRDGEVTSYAGLVISRQRPHTARGVVFMTLEDETGFLNSVIWQDVYDKYRFLVKRSSFLGIKGKLQVEDEVCHLVAWSLWIPELSLQVQAKSRDFK